MIDTPLNYKVRNIDESNPDELFIGYSRVGDDESYSNWIIKKIITTATSTVIRYATGAWVDRATLVYA